MDIGALFSQLYAFITGFATMSTAAKISGIVLLIIAIMKSSFLAPVWAKLGNLQVLVAPVLAIAVSMVAIQPFTWATFSQSLISGTVAIGVHQLLDGIKTIPGLGSIYISVINFFESILQAPAATMEKQIVQK
jgi:hypothetical protein